MSQISLDEKPKRRANVFHKFVAAAATLSAIAYLSCSSSVPSFDKLNQLDLTELLESKSQVCPVAQKLIPPKLSDDILDISYFRSDEYKNHSLAVWGGAVKAYSPSFDDLGEIGEDPRWDVFYDIEAYLKKTFPTVHSVAQLDHVNTHGLVYTIKGSDESLKPIMLTGHQDVVPVPEETEWRWKHPPTEAFYDGTWLWGRGASDCKNNVIGIFEAVEQLLSTGFKPKRTILLVFGFDEESSGNQGASHIGPWLVEKLGKDSVLLIVDEGGLGISDFQGSRFALPSTGEKGYIDIEVKINTPGGHSSVPPKHTSIGMISEVAVLLEQEEYPLDVTEVNPYFQTLQCQAKYAENMDEQLRKGILNLDVPEIKAQVVEKLAQDGTNKALMSTTRAVDVVYGGVKINALPEEVILKINHRVSYESSLDIVKQHIIECVQQVAEKYGLGLNAFGDELLSISSAGNFVVTSDSELNQAPTTSTFNNPTWDVLTGTIKHIFEDFAIYDDSYDPEVSSEVFVAPSCMTGNTDTKYYWDLTKNIYRFTPIKQRSRENAHAIDERVELDAHIEGVAWYYEFIQNVDHYISE